MNDIIKMKKQNDINSFKTENNTNKKPNILSFLRFIDSLKVSEGDSDISIS